MRSIYGAPRSLPAGSAHAEGLPKSLPVAQLDCFLSISLFGHIILPIVLLKEIIHHHVLPRTVHKLLDRVPTPLPHPRLRRGNLDLGSSQVRLLFICLDSATPQDHQDADVSVLSLLAMCAAMLPLQQRNVSFNSCVHNLITRRRVAPKLELGSQYTMQSAGCLGRWDRLCISIKIVTVGLFHRVSADRRCAHSCLHQA